MHILIKELAEEAKVIARAKLGHPLASEAFMASTFQEEFARLIVDRCTAIISLYRRDNLENKAIADTLEAARQEIKLSFGMKP